MKIAINAAACKTPLECRICLTQCPGQIFGAVPQKPREEGIPARDWKIVPLFSSQCSGCMECAVFCPVHAINVNA